MTFPKSPEELTATWLGDTLKAAGVSSADAIEGLTVEPFAEGLGILGKLVRVHAQPATDAAPRSFVAKFPCDAEANLQLAHGMRFYQREHDFYTHAAAQTPFRVPAIHFQAIDAEHNFVLLMEDLDQVTMCDQVAGATAEQVVAIVPALAKHHAAFWQRELDWAVSFRDPALAQIIESIYAMCKGPTLDAFADVISNEMREVIEAVDGNIGTLWNTLCDSPTTLVHGDFRVDNIGFEPDGSVVAFDWQICGINTGPYDLGFMMSQSVNPEVREQIEQDQVRAYHRTLCDNGVDDYTFDTCMRDYRRTILACIIYPVITCGMLDVSTERGREFGRLSLRRSLSAIEALNAQDLLPG